MSTSATETSKFKVLGICGGIGSGKSNVCQMLVSSLGCLAHLDTDSIAHSVYTPGSEAIQDIVAEFGDNILQENGKEIDRKALGSIVFADRNAMAKLEQIVWPHVKTIIIDRIEGVKDEWDSGKATGTVPVVILEAAVLLDAGWDDLLDGLWVVTAPKSVAIQRLMETRGLTKEEAEKRIEAQVSRRGIGNLDEELKSGTVTRVIDNSGSLEDLEKSLQEALQDPKAWK